MFKVALMLEAQFCMHELDRRHGSWTARRDLLLELVVILLIGWEIWLGFRAERNEDALMDKQNAILANLAHSTADTATTMKGLALTSQTMNAALQKQLGFNYAVSLEVNVNGGMEVISVRNSGPADITIWGQRVGDERAAFQKDGQGVARDGTYNIPASALLRDVSAQAYNARAKVAIPLDVYLTNTIGKKYVARCSFVADYSSSQMHIYAVLRRLDPINWVVSR